MVFYRNFRKLLKSRSVLSCMFHSGFRENRWHCSEPRRPSFEFQFRLQLRQEAFTHLLYTNSENHVVKSSLDQSPSFSKSCRSCCHAFDTFTTGIRSVQFLGEVFGQPCRSLSRCHSTGLACLVSLVRNRLVQ